VHNIAAIASECLLRGDLRAGFESPELADSVEKLEIPATTNFALM
jgi:hypothetical protein